MAAGQHVYASGRDLATRGARDVVNEVKKFGGFATTEVADQFESFAVALTPVGGVLSKPTKAHPPGLMKRSWKRAAVASAKGRAWAIANSAPHAGIINRGRLRGFTLRRATNAMRWGQRVRNRKGNLAPNARAPMLGSQLAPQGITKPVYQRLKKQEKEITRVAIARAEKGL